MSTLQHVAFIMDGNRRFAKRLLTEPWRGHEFGSDKFSEVLGWLKDENIHEATFYAFSTENFNRPVEEFNYLMRIFKESADKAFADQSIHRDHVRFTFIGALEKFPEQVRSSMQRLMDATRDYHNYQINIAIGYGGRQEITNAVQAIASKVAAGDLLASAITADTVTAHLALQSEPDLIIRTGGEVRTSNFLVWQSTYAEWYFSEKMWPEFSKEDFLAAIQSFHERKRRFGK